MTNNERDGLEDAGTTQPSLGDEFQGGVPAVRSAAAILRFLHERSNEPATMSQVARALAMNRSTCFNMLKTLERERLLAYDARAKTYELGFRLVELASLVDSHRQVVDVAMKHATELVEQVQLTCLIARFGDGEFLVVDRVDSPKPIKVTVEVGTRFPPNAAVMAKSHYAFQDAATVDDMLERYGLPPYVDNTITDEAQFREALAEVRSRGFAHSLAEYWPDHHALSSPVFDGAGRVSHQLVLVGFAFEISAETVEVLGGRLRETAARVTAEIGGAYPADVRAGASSDGLLASRTPRSNPKQHEKGEPSE